MPKKITKKRRRRSLVAKSTRRRRSHRKKGMLGDMFTPAIARGAARAVVNGAVGGGIATVMERLLYGKVNPFWRVAAPFASGFLAAAVFKQPEVAAGIAAVGTKVLMQEAGMAENDNMYLQDHPYANDVKQLPPVLDVDGQPLSQDDEMYLQDGDYQVGYAPEFGSPTRPVTVDEIV